MMEERVRGSCNYGDGENKVAQELRLCCSKLPENEKEEEEEKKGAEKLLTAHVTFVWT